MGLDIGKVTKEFIEFDLNPGKINTGKIFGELLTIKQTLDLSSMEKCRVANAFLASLFQVVGYKVGICHYWERMLEEELRMKKLEVKLRTNKGETKLTREELSDTVDNDPEVTVLYSKASVASASRFFWSGIMDILHEIAKRVDSASASLGVESKMRNIGG